MENVILDKLVSLDLADFTIKGNVSISSEFEGTLNISTGTITGDLTVNTPNATVNNEATVDGTITIKDVKSGTWNENVSGNTLVFNAAGKTLKIADGVKVENLTLDANNAKVTIAETASFTNPVEIKKETTIISTKSVQAKVAAGVKVIVKADEDAAEKEFIGAEDGGEIPLDPKAPVEDEDQKAVDVALEKVTDLELEEVTVENIKVAVKAAINDENITVTVETVENGEGTHKVTLTKGEKATASKVITVSKKEEVDPTVANVTDFNGLKATLGNTTIKTINITADITNIDEALVVNHAVTINGGGKTLSFISELNGLGNGQRQGILVNADGTEINNLSVVMAGDAGWQGVYGIQVYNATGVVLNNVTASGADGGVLVNGSAVELTGEIIVSGNEFGGIEVSRGEKLTKGSKLTVTGNLVNIDEKYAEPTIWLVKEQGEVIGVNDFTINEKVKDDQIQYYLKEDNAVDSNAPQAFAETFETTVTEAIGSQGEEGTYEKVEWPESSFTYTTDGAFYTLQLSNSKDELVTFASVFEEFTLQTNESTNIHDYTSGDRNKADFGLDTAHKGTKFLTEGSLKDTSLNGTLFYGIHSGIYGVNIPENTNIKIFINGTIKEDATPGNYTITMKLNKPTRKDKDNKHTFEEFKNVLSSPVTSKEFTVIVK